MPKSKKTKKSKTNKSKKKSKIAADRKAEIDDKTQAVFQRKGYKVLTILGAGAFGEVFKAESLYSDLLCAVKVMNLDKMSKKYKQKFLPRELAALIEIRHENIIRVYDIFRSNRKIYVFMEFASNGDIAKHLKKNGPMTEEKAREWFMQISNALNYLHEEMYTAHRDIKIDNILLNDNYVAKLTDFGFATEAIDSDGAIVMSETFCGTMPYYCPQILSKKAYNPFKADVWAHGIVLYAMTHNRFPFHFKDRKVMIKEQQNKKYIQSRIKKTASDEMRDLLMKMLEVEENDRLSFKEVLAHKWANKAEESEN